MVRNIKIKSNKKEYVLMTIIILIILIWISFLISGELYGHIVHSIKRILIWFFSSSVIWIFFWFILGINKKISFVRYIFEVIRPIPPIARIPLAILRFWLWDSSSYFIVFIWSFFPIFTNVYFWITSIPDIYLDATANLELTKFDYYYNILRKYSLPYIFAWLKIWLWMWWMSLIAAELIWAQSWLGYYIQINRLLLNTENIILGMILIGVIWFWLNYWLTQIEKSLVRWKE